MRKVYCATLGCDKNLVDSEALLGRFLRDGVRPVQDPDEADIWVLNSCGFIDAARADSEQTLRDMAAAKGERTLVVTGCWSQEHGEAIRGRFPEVDVVAGVGRFDEVVAAVREGRAAAGLDPPVATDFPLAGSPLTADPMTAPYVGLVERPLLTPGHLAFVKIGEGCNCACTFCRIPLIRGKLRSRPAAEILAEVRALAARGVTEIQLVSQNTSDYGRDTGENLVDLVTALDAVDGLRRIRLLYLYAGLIAVDDLRRLLDLGKVAPYLEIPVQHASPRILRAMKRPGGFKASPGFFAALRADRPDLVLRSTALLGFPGEEDEDVEILADYLAEVRFDHLGTYRYSPEPGTGAEHLADRVPPEVIHDREALVMDLQAEISQSRMDARLGRSYDAVIDRIVAPGDREAGEILRVAQSLAEGNWADDRERFGSGGVPGAEACLALARSYHFGYDLDGVIVMDGAGRAPGQWVRAEFRGATPYDVWAREAG